MDYGCTIVYGGCGCQRFRLLHNAFHRRELRNIDCVHIHLQGMFQALKSNDFAIECILKLDPMHRPLRMCYRLG